MEEIVVTDRPPRLQPELPFDEIAIPAPPDKNHSGMGRFIQAALPIIAVVGYVLISSFGGARNPIFVIPMALSVVATVVFSFYTYRQERLRREAVERGYAERLVQMNKEMHNYHDMQRRFYRYNYPDYPTSERIVSSARTEVAKHDWSLRGEVRLWERRVGDDDFGVIRLGVGTLPSTVTYVPDDIENFDDPQARAALKLANDSRYVDNIPIIISLRQPSPQTSASTDDPLTTEQDETRRTPVVHALGIAGQRGDVYTFIRALLAHYLVFHSPFDTRLYVLASQEYEWDWIKYVPHSQASEQASYYCFTREKTASVSAYNVEETGEVDKFLEGVRKILAQRKIQLQENDREEGQGNPVLPFLLVVVDLLDAIYDVDDSLHDVETTAAMSILLEEGALLGAAVIFLVPERSKVPSGCQSVIEVQRTASTVNRKQEHEDIPYFRYAEVGVNSFRYLGQVDSLVTRGAMQALAQDLGRLDVRQSSGATLPGSVPFLDLMGWQDLADLQTNVVANWQTSMQAEHARWLRVKVGRVPGNKPRSLTFSSQADGVHGIVAGSTGSGKSEMLISLIIGLAVMYDPRALNFVLVDYKGGGAFSDFKNLPHCVDIITNLAEDSVDRMFASIGAEIKRREGVLVDAGTKHIVEYYRQGKHIAAPLPFLFIIIDEFAEMIAEKNEFKSELERITRLGRSLGVSLILAAQRPSGVTDQMRANIKFRICLRVENPGESREMLRRSDAAYLPSGVPGRGYLQVGNEEIELIQVAYTGDDYTDPSQAPREKVRWLERKDYTDLEEPEPEELYKEIITTLNTMAHQQGLEAQRAPWPNLLPTRLALAERLSVTTSEAYVKAADLDRILLGQERDPTQLTLNPALTQWISEGYGWIEQLDWEKYALRPVIGLIDHPYEAKHLPLIVELPQGHTVVFGASGWGKTTFIRTMLLSLATTHSPDYVHFYVLDLGGRNLGLLKDLPHTGAFITPDEEGYKERVEQLLRELGDMVDKRKVELYTNTVGDVYEYNRANPHKAYPAVVVAIDNFLEFIEAFGQQADDTESVLDRFMTLARQSRTYGIHFVISINQPSNLPTQIYNLFTERFTFKLTDTSDYRTVVGMSVPEIRGIPGRGYTKIGRYPLAFQVAVPLNQRSQDPGDVVNENWSDIGQLIETIARYAEQATHEYQRPCQIDSLPRSVLLKQLLVSPVRGQPRTLQLDEHFLTHLQALTEQRWQDSLDPQKAGWLKALIGVLSGGRPCLLEFEATKSGVHGLIAGGTGSGKSELLMTLIVALALNYDPKVLNFVLVDYKGGGTFAAFEHLPHCVDMITNLNKSGVQRMFTAIRAEMDRRQKLNSDTGVSDIVQYRERGHYKRFGPYPHLVIIIDEYAEMITDMPEFRDELDSIARVGRSIGINLLLASQRPTNVSDQMRANIKLRICLRVEGVDASREMLRRSDAAFLPSGMPGRGYVQVGNDQIDLVQVAYTGEKYEYDTPPEGEEQRPFYRVMIEMLKRIAGQAVPLSPWPAALPATLDMSYALRPDYMQQQEQVLMKMGKHKRLTINPFAQDWLQSSSQWPGVDWRTNAMRAVVGLLDDPYQAKQHALRVDFAQGHAVVFGASGWGKTTFLRSLVLSLACTHSPNEFHCHILDLGGPSMDALQTFPHVGVIVTPNETGYEERIQQLWRNLNEILEQRKQLFSKAGVQTLAEYNLAQLNQGSSVLPALLLVIDNITEFIETFGDTGSRTKDQNNLLEALVLMARQGKPYGLHIIITANRLNALSSKLYSLFTERYALRLSDTGDYSAIVGSQVTTLEGMKGRGYTRVGYVPLSFQVALPPGVVENEEVVHSEMQQIRAIVGNMHNAMRQSGQHYQEPLRITALPKSEFYRTVLAQLRHINQDEQNFLEELAITTQKTWLYHNQDIHADWLRVALGPVAGNRLRQIYLEATNDGVHGLIAGGTGSGKSELLMTLVVGLALNYSPEILNFLLVDFKGGGSFKPFEQLPHCVDIVTNLDATKVDRMFTAINAEIRRRQALNAITNTKDIVAYRKANLHHTHEPYPHLFIIIDEYAEMIDNHPQYRTELDSITRVGRSLGINLFLAAQSPKGVSEQMRANIKLRLCLRVEQHETSQELLRRPDAALLPSGQPGRGYLQIGNENMELIQVGWCGELQPHQQRRPVLWPQRPEAPQSEYSVDDSLPLFTRVVTLAQELYGNRMAPRLWPSFLPDQFSLQVPLLDAQTQVSQVLNPAVTDWINDDTETLWAGMNWQDAGAACCPPVGLIDQPADGQQPTLHFDLKQNHVVVMGDAGMGKTTFLRTLIISLATTHSPAELHVYVLEMGGRSFRALQQLPHVGAVLYNDEDSFAERSERLLSLLERLCDERQQIISDAGSDTIYQYNGRFPSKPLPAVVVAIDNFVELQEDYPNLVESVLLPLLRRSSRVGISFVVTCNVPSNMLSKLYNLFAERITLKQTNPDRYIDIVGRGAIEIEDIPGRGYIRRGRQPLLFQIAQPVGLPTNDLAPTRPEAEDIELIAQHMNSYVQRNLPNHIRPDAIDILPDYVVLDEVLHDQQAVSARRTEAVLGIDGNLEHAFFDFKRLGPHFIVAGPPLSGKTTVLYSLVLSLALRYPPERVKFILIDRQRTFFERGNQRKLADLPHVVAVASEESQVKAIVPHLEQACQTLKEQEPPCSIFVIIDNYDDFRAEISKSNTGPSADLARLARRYGREGLHFIVGDALQDPSTTDLRRCIKSSKYGIGLQEIDLHSAFGITSKIPKQTLPPGRGYIVRAGHQTMIQVATPYDLRAGDAHIADADEVDEEAHIQQALDNWITRLCERYPEPNPRWIADTEAASVQADALTNDKTGFDRQTQQQIRALTRAMHMELAHVQKQLREGNGEASNGGITNLRSARMIETLATGGQVNTQELVEHVIYVWRTECKERQEPEVAIEAVVNSPASEVLLSFENWKR